MFYDLFSNITIVAAFLFLIGQIFGRYPLDNQTPLHIRVILGFSFGVLGILLMLYSIDVTDTIIVDLRNIAIITAGVVGGPVSTFITAILIAIYRVAHFGINNASIVALITALALGACCAVISKLKLSRFNKFFYMLISALLLSTAAFFYLIQDTQRLLSVFAYYIPISVFGVVLAYFAVEYIISRQVLEHKLIKSNVEISDILGSIQDAFFTLDRNWVLTYVNKEFIRILTSYDQKFSDILGQCIYDIFPKEQYSHFYSQFQLVMDQKLPVHFEGYSLVTQHWYSTSVYPKSNGISVYFKDITDQKLISQKLVESEERFRSLVNSINDIVYTLDRDQRHTGVFGNWLKMSGISENFFLGKTARDLLGPEAAIIHEEANRRALQGEHVVYDWSDRNENQITYYQTSISPIRNYRSEIIGIVGIGRDVTVTRLMEESLRESEERFRTAFDYAAVGMALSTLDGQFVAANEPYCKMLGYNEEELKPLTFYSLTHPDDVTHNRETVQELINGKIQSFQIEKRYLHKAGHIIWAQVNAAVLRDKEDKPQYLIAQAQDITDRIMSEEELRQINKALIEQRAEAERQREEAMQANRHKSQFLATMSHELRTPLNSIIGFTNRVIKKCSDILPKTQQENLMIVRDEAEHLLELINSLLDYSKIEAGKMEVYAEQFDLKEIVDEVSAMTKNIYESKHLKYQQLIPNTDDILIYSDKLKTKQILINLLSNAFKYSDSGIIRLSVKLEEKFYRIDIEDEGIGISIEHLESIFDEFRQVDGTYTRKVGGTGLGLSITKRFVEMLGGSIKVQSTLGEGSKFTVYLPVRYSEKATS